MSGAVIGSRQNFQNIISMVKYNLEFNEDHSLSKNAFVFGGTSARKVICDSPLVPLRLVSCS